MRIPAISKPANSKPVVNNMECRNLGVDSEVSCSWRYLALGPALALAVVPAPASTLALVVAFALAREPPNSKYGFKGGRDSISGGFTGKCCHYCEDV